MNVRKVNFKDNAPLIRQYYESNRITVDSFWEDHVIKSNHYQIISNHDVIGFFAIFEKMTLTLFHVFDQHAQLGCHLFQLVKRYEQITNAFVPTGDEFFLSHCLDHFMRIEKQAYFSIYRDEPLDSDRQIDLELIRILTETDTELLSLAGDFFDEDAADRILNGSDYFQVYKVAHNGEIVGFGVIELGRVIKNIASIGMFVMEDKRQKGYAANILKILQRHVESKGYQAISGCWYYNHNSLKSMESAGAYSKTRLLRVYF
ncbi:MAG TPA: N-acetyltransferase [Clostridiales bacterium UBA8960]|jgi:GNAT superfamily N-acetyltransferase|nr:N-acetyltransferase [Clostridiales bacterium UBA8960]